LEVWGKVERSGTDNARAGIREQVEHQRVGLKKGQQAVKALQPARESVVSTKGGNEEVLQNKFNIVGKTTKPD